MEIINEINGLVVVVIRDESLASLLEAVMDQQLID